MGSTLNWLNLALLDCNVYVPVSNLALISARQKYCSLHMYKFGGFFQLLQILGSSISEMTYFQYLGSINIQYIDECIILLVLSNFLL